MHVRRANRTLLTVQVHVGVGVGSVLAIMMRDTFG